MWGPLRALRGSALRLDIYAWLTYRMSYLQRPTTVRWPSLRAQFGSDLADTKQGRASPPCSTPLPWRVSPARRCRPARAGLRSPRAPSSGGSGRCRALDAKLAELVAAGMTVIERPQWTDDAKDLATIARRTGVELTAESHAECPGHAAYVEVYWDVDEDADDLDEDERRVAEATYVCPRRPPLPERKEAAKAERRRVLDTRTERVARKGHHSGPR
jgi:hypothetical protein